jgi:hypothetical protein
MAEMRNVGFASSEKIIYAQHIGTVVHQAVAQMTSQKSCAASNKDFFQKTALLKKLPDNSTRDIVRYGQIR